MAPPARTVDTQSPIDYAGYLRDVMQKGILGGHLPTVTNHPSRLEAQARKHMSVKGFDYVKGGAGESSTVDANRLAFRQWRIIPRVLKPTSPRDLSVTLFGRMHDTPVIMAPVGCQSLYHQDREIGTARACGALRIPFTLSTAASISIEELVHHCPEGCKWFQLYRPTDDEITKSILRRAQRHGFEVLLVTLDTWTLGWRPRDLDKAKNPFLLGEGDEVGFKDPVFRAKFAERSDGDIPEENTIAAAAYWLSECFSGVSHSWADIQRLRDHWDGPIVKGILSVEDARLAVQHGVDGIVVSDHGGRQLDGAVASLDVLPEIVDAVGDQTTVLFDSGVRTGADIVKALALGARAILVGRPIMYGLGIEGRAGAEAVLAGLLADLDLTMGFTGVKSIPELRRSMLRHVPQVCSLSSNL